LWAANCDGASCSLEGRLERAAAAIIGGPTMDCFHPAVEPHASESV
jgi:hypothetical protein